MTSTPADDIDEVGLPARGESRLPMALAVLSVGALHALYPRGYQLAPVGVYGGFLGLFLLVLIIGDPGRIDRDRQWLRVTTVCMIGLITLVNTFAAIRLVVDIFDPHAFSSAGELLRVGAVVWGTNIIAFALWFWDLDGGGAAARLNATSKRRVAFVFPEMNYPDHVAAGWYPQFVDYLSLSFNTATAFSPTDVSAVKRWAKLLMIAESAVSLALATLVVARAINIL